MAPGGPPSDCTRRLSDWLTSLVAAPSFAADAEAGAASARASSAIGTRRGRRRMAATGYRRLARGAALPRGAIAAPAIAAITSLSVVGVPLTAAAMAVGRRGRESRLGELLAEIELAGDRAHVAGLLVLYEGDS